MKRLFGHTKKPAAYWEENRRGGYDWEDEDFSYDEMGDEDYEDSVDEEPEQAPAEYSVESAGKSENADGGEPLEESGYESGEPLEKEGSDDGIEFSEELEENTWEDTEESGYEDEEYPEEAKFDDIEYLEEPEESAGEYAEETGYDGGEHEEEPGYEDGEYPEEAKFDDIEYLEEPEESAGEYAEETEYDGSEEYAEETGYEDSEEYAEETGYEDGGEYAEETGYEDSEEYAEETGYEDGEEYGEETGYGDDAEFPVGAGYEEGREDGNSSDIQYIEDESEDTEEEEIYRELERRRKREKEKNKRKSASMIDGAIAFSGVAVVLLAVVVCIFLFRSGLQGNEEPDFLSVGNQIQGIELIGGKGIAAVANAEMQKIADANEADVNVEDSDSNYDYDENDLTTTVAVVMTLTSVKNDLKIKFSNRESSKLIGNVRFVAKVTKPDGTVEDWTDSDLDGIIYEKNITAGKYSISLKALEDEKYSNLVLPATAQTVTVKSNIEYKKVDVTGEGKKESEINANEEDTKKNETSEESALTDTVAWVPSTSTGNTYVEVLKSAIPDPLTRPIEVAKAFRRVTEVSPSPSTDPTTDPNTTPSTDPNTETTTDPNTEPTTDPGTTTSPEPSDSPAPTPEPSDSPTPTPEPSDSPTPTPDPGDSPTESPDPTPTPTPEPSTTPSTEPSTTPSTEPSASPEVKITLALDAEQKNLQVMKAGDGSVTAEKASVKATVQAEGAKTEDIVFSCNTADGNVATASISGQKNGEAVIDITAVGVGETKITVTASYQLGTAAEVKESKVISVKVTEKPALTMSLDKTELLAYSEVADKPLEVMVTVNNSMMKAEDLGNTVNLSAQTSDSTVATVTKKEYAMGANGSFTVKLTLVPQVLTEKKSCTLNVSYQEGGETVSAKCAVTIKPHPKNDKTTKLLDNSGQTLYVMENNAYREAVYADYYTDVKFFVQSGVKYTGWQTLDGKVYYYTAEGQYVTGEQVIQGAKYNFGPDGVLMTGNGVLGIDVSKWNGTIDWKAVKNSGVTFVIIRCGYRGSSQGMLVEDPKFTANIKGATDAGLKVGVYFFTQAVDEVEAVYEASYVLEKVKNYKLSYPIFLDVESSGGRGDKISKETRTQVCKAFCQTIQNAGYTAGVYANKNWFTEKINADELGAYRIWLAQYAAAPTYTGRYDIWQYKSTGSINGISGNVDMNLSYMGY